MIRKRMGYMHWGLAILIIKLIFIPVNDIMPAVVSVYLERADSINQAVYIGMAAVIAFQLLQNYLWLLFTSRRYFIGIIYTLYCVVRIFGGMGYETYLVTNAIKDINDRFYFDVCTARPIYMFIVGVVLLAGMYFLFYRRNLLELSDNSDSY